MMEATLSMRRLIESNATTAAAASTTAEVDSVLPTTMNQAHQLAPNMGRWGWEILGSTSGPHRGYNRNFYPYSLPSNFTPPTMHENVDHAVPVTFEGQLRQPIGGTHEEPRSKPKLTLTRTSRCTTGLADQFGKKRVFNTPLCEQVFICMYFKLSLFFFSFCSPISRVNIYS